MAARKTLILLVVVIATIAILRLRTTPPLTASAKPTVLQTTPSPAATEPSPPAALPATSSFPGITTAPGLPESASPGILSHWHGRLSTPLRSRAPTPDEDLHLPLRFAFPLSADRQVRVRIDRHNETGPDSGVFIGEAEDHPGSVVILSYVGLAQAGVVQLSEERRSFVINGDETGQVRITTCDLDQAPHCTPPLLPPTENTDKLVSSPSHLSP